MRLMKNASTLLFVFASLLLSSCSNIPPAEGGVTHIVLAWLKRPGCEADRAKLIEAAKGLKADIPEVQSLSVGRSIPSGRPIVDSSFDVALVMKFKSRAAMDSYEKSRAHVKAATKVLKPLTSKIVVHDFTNE